MNYIKTFENMDKAKSIISKKMMAFDKLKELLKNNMGYIGKFTEFLINENVPMKDLEELYEDLLNLNKNNIKIDIEKLDYEETVDLIILKQNNLSINKTINEFPSVQKELARKMLKNSYDSSFKNSIIKLSNHEKLKYFLKKISRYKTEDELTNAINLFIKDVDNDRDIIKNKIKNTEKSKIVYENDDLLILYINNVEDLKLIASDTSWCILRQYSFNQYTEKAFQYVLFDFTKDEYDVLFKIGFTVNYDGSLKTSHDILDNYISDYTSSLLNKYKIKYSDIKPELPNHVIDVIDVNKVNKRTTIKKLEELLPFIEKTDIPKLIENVLNDNDDISYNKKAVILKYVYLYFSDKSIINVEEIKALHPLISTFYFDSNFNRKIFNEKEFRVLVNRDVMLKQLDECTFEAFNKCSVSNIDNIFIHGFAKNTDLKRKVKDKFNEIYTKVNKEKLSENFINCILYINYYFKNIDFIEDIKIPNELNIRFPYVFELEFKLESNIVVTNKNIELIIPDNYPNIEIIFTNIFLIDNKLDDFLDKFNDYKVNFVFYKKAFSDLKLSIKYNIIKNINFVKLIKSIPFKYDTSKKYYSDDKKMSIRISRH
jgi:hypothetical protein